MAVDKKAQASAEVRVENVGGIDETTVTLSPGLTVLEGRNATNRTSFLRGLMAACGSNDATVKGDAERARIELTIDGETYTRSLRRTGGSIQTSGESYLDDPTLAELFAFLLESNEARRAVATGDNLREIIMRPVDTDAIETEIDRLIEERRRLEEELEEMDELERDLPELEQERARLEERIEGKRVELEERRESLEEFDIEARREEEAEIQEKLDELSDMRSQLDETRYDIETERESLSALEEEKAELEDELAELPDAPAGELEEEESAIERLRSRKQSIEAEIADLQSIISFNEEMLEGTNPELLGTIGEGEERDETVTDELLEGGRVTCWTCGTTVSSEKIETILGKLRKLNRSRLEDAREAQSALDERKERRRVLEEEQRRRDEIERRLSRIDGKVDEQEAAIEHLEERRQSLNDEIDAIEDEIDELETDSHNELLDIHRELNQLEYKLGGLQNDRERVEERIESIESRLDDREDVEAEREAVKEEITEHRTKIERVAEEAVERFNEHMDVVLSVLEYDNLERIWLESVEQEVQEGRRKVTRDAFELHVVRSTDSGTTYQDTADHLSESEREVTGLVFALAGYLAHDVHETVPFLLLDSLEAIDAERIGTLVKYLADYPEYLVVALLPEDASALDEEYHHISDI